MTTYFEREKGLPMPDNLKQEVGEAVKKNVVFDEDCPELTKEMKDAFIVARKKKPYRGGRVEVT